MNERDFLDLPLVTDSPLAANWHLPIRPTIIRAAPITVDGGEFQLHPDPARAHPLAWHPIAAVRIGLPSWSDEKCAVAGECVEFVALRPDASRVVAQFNHYADVIGTPPDELFASARGGSILRLRPSPAHWLTDLQGAVLLRPAIDAAPFIRTFRTVVCDDVRHGDQIDKALNRAYKGPEIRVLMPPQRRPAA